MDMGAAVDELYGVALPDFVRTRTRLVAAAKGEDPELATQISALRKPTLAAWLLNQVARQAPEVIADLSELGERMRTAQAKGDGATLAEARPERRAVIDDLIAAAGQRAADSGVKFGPSARDEIDATAVAALADEQSSRALASGHLLRPLSYAGFGEVELDDAVATPLRLLPPLPEHEFAEDGQAPVDEAEGARQEELRAAHDELREAERDLSAARLAESAARTSLLAARDRTAELEARVARAAAAAADLETRPSAKPPRDPASGAGS